MKIIEHLSDFLGRRQSILVETSEHHGGETWWRILVEKQAHNEQRPIVSLSIFAVYELT